MNTLLATLAQRDSAPFDCIVHIGAGAYASLEDYAPLESKHLLLVEADPEAFAELAERHAGSESVTVLKALVGGIEESRHFHRFSLPMLNSPLGIGRLCELYPRVELLETLPMQAVPLATILAEHTPAFGCRNLLVLDIPSQAAAVCAAFPKAFLEKFEWILVCGASESWHDGGETLVQATECLAKVFFESVDQTMDDQAWPAKLYRLDSVKTAMQAELDNRASQLIAREDEVRLQAERIQQLEDLYKNLVTQSAERDRHISSQCDSLRAERDKLVAEKAALDSLISTLATERDALAVQNTTLVGERGQLAERVTSLEGTKHQLAGEVDALRQQQQVAEGQIVALSTERDNLAAERSTLDARLSALTAERDELATRHQSLAAESEPIRAARDTLANRLDEAQKQLQTERRIVESLANSIQSNAQSFRQVALALHPPSLDGLRPENSKLNAPASTVSQENTPAHHNFEFLGNAESKAVSAFLKGLSAHK